MQGASVLGCQFGEHVGLDRGARSPELGYQIDPLGRQAGELAAPVAWIWSMLEQTSVTEAIENRDGVAGIDPDRAGKPLLVCLTELGQGHQRAEMVRRESAFGEHPRPQAS